MATDNLTTEIPSGTSVVLHTAHGGRSAGTAGVVIQAPGRTDELYLVEFADGTRDMLPRDAIRSRRRMLADLVSTGRRTDEDYLSRVAYRCVVGSTAFGLATDQSDEDERGFYIAPQADLLGLRITSLLPPNQIEGAKDPMTRRPLPGEDWVYWEIGHYIEQLLKANPSVLETLWTPLVRATSEVAEYLREQRHLFLTKQIASTYAGYALSQMNRMEEDVYAARRAWERWEKRAEAALQRGEPEPEKPTVPNVVDERDYRGKHGMHLMRLLHSGVHALRTGELMVEVPPALREELLRIRNERPPISALKEAAQAYIYDHFNPAHEASHLPEEPDWQSANDLLVWARHQPLSLRTVKEPDLPSSKSLHRI